MIGRSAPIVCCRYVALGWVMQGAAVCLVDAASEQ